MEQEFHFLRPLWLLTLPLLAVILYRAWRRQAGEHIWRRVCDTHLLNYLGVDLPASGRAIWALLGLCWLLTVLALAGPAWEKTSRPLFERRSALVLIVNLAESMRKTDIAPDRISRARYALLDILDQSTRRDVALVVFSGDAYVVSPLTSDANTLRGFVRVLAPELMPAPGARAGPSLALAKRLLADLPPGDGQVLLVGDSVQDIAETLIAARELNRRGVSVSTLTLGDDVDALRRVAHAGGGLSTAIGAERVELAKLFPGKPSGEARRTALQGTSWRDMGPWILLALLPLAAGAFRRGLLLTLVLGVSLPPPVHALDWPWRGADSAGAEALARGEAARAAGLFADPEWRGVALYRAGEYTAAAEAFAQSDSADGHYNRGNALARAGNLAKAVAAYGAALAIQPGHTHARENRALVEDLLARRPEPARQPDDAEDPRRPSAPSGKKPGNRSGEQPTAAPDKPPGPMAPRPAPPSRPQTAIADDAGRTSPDPEASRRPGDDPGAPTATVARREQQQALKQWLRRIPDDPGGLLRRKFAYLHRLRGARGTVD